MTPIPISMPLPVPGPISTADATAGPTELRYDVDPEQLRSLAAGLRRTREAIQGLGRFDHGTRAALGSILGSMLVSRELDELDRSWSVARSRIGDQLDLLAQAGDVAAQAYGTVDGNVLAALAGPALAGPAPTHGPAR